MKLPERERVMRTLTFWLRPRFVLRVVNRFQKVAGFDRAIALASSALTAVIPLAIVTSSLATQLGGKDTAERIIDRYDLSGGGAEAVRDIFSPPNGSDTSLGIIGLCFLLIAVLSFTRTMQRLFEQTWELKPLSVRNSANGLLWIGGLVLYISLSGVVRGLLGRTDLDVTATLLLLVPSAAFLYWSGRVLSAGRIPRQQLVPFALLGAALLGIYSIGAEVYVPHLFSTYATRYGVIGAVFAIISALFCVMVVTVGSAAAGREVADELERIRKGERPADDEVRAQWNEITAEARLRWETIRTRRSERSGKDGEEQEGGEQREVHAALLQGGPPGQDREAGHDDRDREQHGLR
jgi:membrane protein